MNILLTGGNGFIGRHLAERLEARGHKLTCVVRDATRKPVEGCTCIELDYARMTLPELWLPHLQNQDAVVNAVGILRERGNQRFDIVHHLAPAALFKACARQNVSRVIQISALGADERAATPFLRSKKNADDVLLGLPVSGVVVQPSLVYGPGGRSAALFNALASLPVIPLPGDGEQRVQPIHIEDLVDALVALIEAPGSGRGRVELVGPRPLPLRTLLTRLRAGLGLPRAPTLSIPWSLVELAAGVAGRLPGSLIDRDTLAMLQRGSVGDVAAAGQILGRAPRSVDHFIEGGSQSAVRARAILDWTLPVLRFSLALVWLWTGVVSLGIYPVDQSYELLRRVGIPESLQPLMLYGAALLDLTIGIAILTLRRRRWLWLLQIALILGYTAVITLWLPEYWLHPYGPIIKNLPLIACILLLHQLEDR